MFREKEEENIKGAANILEMVYFSSWVIYTWVFVMLISRCFCEHEIFHNAIILFFLRK